MIPERGPRTWLDLPVLSVPPLIAGRQMAEYPTEWRASHPGASPGIPTGGGTTIRQRAPADRLAPRIFQQTFTLAAYAVESDDWRHLGMVRDLGSSFELFVHWQHVDVWRIREDDPVRTAFQLSRPFPLDLFTLTAVPPQAFIEDVPGSPSPAGTVELTVVGSGVPGAGEILIPAGQRVVEVATEDLAPEGPFRQLRLEYFPLYTVTLQSSEWTWSGGNDLSFSWTLLEHLPPRTWRATYA